MNRAKILGGYILLLAPVLLMTAFAQGSSSGGSFAVTGHVLGTGISTGGSFGLVGTIATTSNNSSAGGNFNVMGGAPELFVFPLGAFDLLISLNGASVQVSWPQQAFGFVLEKNATIGTGSWQPVSPQPTGSLYTTTPSAGAEFYRLRHP